MPIFELSVCNLLAGSQPANAALPMPTPLILAEISGAQWIAIAAILGGLTFTILLIFFGLKFVQRRQELWHETARVALEKGQPLPPLPRDMQAPRSEPRRATDFRAGLVLLATGVGLYLFFQTFLPALRFVAAIPACIGVALLLFLLLSDYREDKPGKPDANP
jgi:hypothetical protein